MNKIKIISNASKQPYISVGRHHGGIRIQGVEYIYIKERDAFIRKDILPKYKKSLVGGISWEAFVEQVSKN